jgi:hypothetical protein
LIVRQPDVNKRIRIEPKIIWWNCRCLINICTPSPTNRQNPTDGKYKIRSATTNLS